MDDQQVKRRQKTSVGAQYPDSRKSDPIPEKALVRCAGCGIEMRGWTGNGGHGVVSHSQLYCCDGCAKNEGCDCVAEAERHTTLNLAKSETDAAPPKPM